MRKAAPCAGTPIVPCRGKHGPRQSIVTRADGALVQVCLRCNAEIAVLVPAHRRTWTDAELRDEAARRQQRRASAQSLPAGPNLSPLTHH